MKKHLISVVCIIVALGLPISFAHHKHEHQHEHKHDHKHHSEDGRFEDENVKDHGAHQHGVAQINLSIEGKKVELELQGALANFISFEYAPHSDAELLEVKAMVNTINDPQKLFILSSNAECSVGTVKLSSDVISNQLLTISEVPQAVDPHSNQATHGNLSVNIEWQCRHPEKLKQVDVALFKYFPNLAQIDVQMVTPSGQGAMKLLPKETRIQW